MSRRIRPTLTGVYLTETTGYLPADIFQAVEPRLSKLGAEAVSPQIREWSADAERNQPYVKGYNVWGARYGYDRLITSEGWKQLGKWGAKHGFVARLCWC